MLGHEHVVQPVTNRTVGSVCRIRGYGSLIQLVCTSFSPFYTVTNFMGVKPLLLHSCSSFRDPYIFFGC
jgi:hypothetical protein